MAEAPCERINTYTVAGCPAGAPDSWRPCANSVRGRRATGRTRSPSSSGERAGRCRPPRSAASSAPSSGGGRCRSPRALGLPAGGGARCAPNSVREPKEYQPSEPADLVQVGTLDVRPLPGLVLRHFTARDVVSRWDVLQVGTQATAASTTRVLDALEAHLPFPLKGGPGRRRLGVPG